MTKRLRVRILAGAAEEFSSAEITFCADFYSVSVPPPCYRSSTLKKKTGHKTITRATPYSLRLLLTLLDCLDFKTFVSYVSYGVFNW